MRLAALTLALATALLAAPGSAGAAAKPKLPHGTLIAGVVVGDLDPYRATQKLKTELEPVYGRRISVRAGGRRTSVSPAQAGQFIRYKAMVDRAYELMGQGQVVIDVPLMRLVRPKALTNTVNRVAGKWYRAPRNASYRYGIRRVSIRGAKYGRGINKHRLRKGLLAEIRRPHDERIVK